MDVSMFPRPNVTERQSRNGKPGEIMPFLAMLAGLALLLGVYGYLVTHRVCYSHLISRFSVVTDQFLFFPFVMLIVTFGVGYFLPAAKRKTFYLWASLVSLVLLTTWRHHLVLQASQFQFSLLQKPIFLIGWALMLYGIVRLPLRRWVTLAILLLPWGYLFAEELGLAPDSPIAFLTGGGLDHHSRLLFFGLFLKSLLYYAEFPTVASEHRGLGNYLLYCFFLPFLFFPIVQPIPYSYFTNGYMAKRYDDIVFDGFKLIALALLYMVGLYLLVAAYAPHMNGRIDPVAWRGFVDGTDRATLWLWYILEFPQSYFAIAGQLFLTIGIFRVLGFDLPSGFRRPFLTYNFLEFWKRWNHYLRDTFMILLFNPVFSRLRGRVPPMATVIGAGFAALILGQFVCQSVIFQVIVPDVGLRDADRMTSFLLIQSARSGIIGALTILTIVVIFRKRMFGPPLPPTPLRRGIQIVLILFYLSVSHVIFKLWLNSGIPPGDSLAILPRLFGFR